MAKEQMVITVILMIASLLLFVSSIVWMISRAIRNKKAPEKYKNLQIRVCGWNVLWNNLSRSEQDAYILRAENIQ